MTAFNSIVKNKRRQRTNKKDGGQRSNSQPQDWAAQGFAQTDWNKHTYQWQGNFPVFTVSPGHTTDGLAGIVARCETVDVAEWFPYGTSPAAIKERLDDVTLEIMRHQADDAEAIDWDEWEALGLATDIDDFMAVGNDC